MGLGLGWRTPAAAEVGKGGGVAEEAAAPRHETTGMRGDVCWRVTCHQTWAWTGRVACGVLLGNSSNALRQRGELRWRPLLSTCRCWLLATPSILMAAGCKEQRCVLLSTCVSMLLRGAATRATRASRRSGSLLAWPSSAWLTCSTVFLWCFFGVSSVFLVLVSTAPCRRGIRCVWPGGCVWSLPRARWRVSTASMLCRAYCEQAGRGLALTRSKREAERESDTMVVLTQGQRECCFRQL